MFGIFPEKTSAWVLNPGVKVAIINMTEGGLSHGDIKYLSEILPRMLCLPGKTGGVQCGSCSLIHLGL